MDIATRAVLTLMTAACLANIGCYQTLAPPVRSTHFGAPGHLKRQDVELSGAATTNGAGGVAVSGGPQLGVAVSDLIAAEAGADLARAGSGWAWTLGYAGIRITTTRPDTPNTVRNPSGWSTDLELGAGLGLGGSLYQYHDGDCLGPQDHADEYWFPPPPCDDQYPADGLSSEERSAGGGYVGFGVGHRWRIFANYFRLRYQLTSAYHIPLTHWATAIYGLQWTVYDRFNVFLGAGIQGLGNAVDLRFLGLSSELGVSIVI